MSNKRTIVPPNKFVDSASEVEPDSLPKANAKSCLKDKRSYDEILSEKLNVTRQKYDDAPPAKKGKVSIRSVQKANGFLDQQQKKLTTTLEKAGLENQKNNRTKQDEVTEKHNITERHEVTRQHDVTGQDDDTVQYDDTVRHDDTVQQDDDTVRHDDTVQQDADTEDHNVTEHLNATEQDDDTEQEDDKRYKDKSRKDGSAEESPDTLIEELRNNNKEISDLKKEIEILRLENNKIRNLNLDLQKILCDEFGVSVSEDAENQETAPENSSVHVQIIRPVGVLNKKNKTIHLGYNIWIDVEKWSSIVVNSNSSASLFARHAARSVFGEDVLKRSSITGKTSNRAVVKEERDKLDPTKILAIQSAFEYWSTKQLTPPLSSTNMQHFKMRMPTYIGKFCDDLRQPAQNSNQDKEKGVDRSTRKQTKLLKKVNAEETDNETADGTEDETGDVENVSERADLTKNPDGKGLNDRKRDASIARVDVIVDKLMREAEKKKEEEEESDKEEESDEEENSAEKKKSDEKKK